MPLLVYCVSFAIFAIEIMKKLIGILLLTLFSATPIAAERHSGNATQTFAQADAPRISVNQGSVTITATADTQITFEVYSMTGQLVKRIRTNDGSVSFDLPRGCYIIRCERWSKKIVVN